MLVGVSIAEELHYAAKEIWIKKKRMNIVKMWGNQKIQTSYLIWNTVKGSFVVTSLLLYQ